MCSVVGDGERGARERVDGYDGEQAQAHPCRLGEEGDVEFRQRGADLVEAGVVAVGRDALEEERSY